MSTGAVARDPKFTVGSNTAGVIKSSPSTLYYESQYSFLPPSCNPSQGAVIRCDVYNSASVAGILTHLDLNFDLDLSAGTTTAAYLKSLTAAMEWIKIYINNVEVMWIQDQNSVFMNYIRNVVLNAVGESDARDEWKNQGGLDTSVDLLYDSGPIVSYQSVIYPLATTPGQKAVRVQIPLDMITSFLFHKFDTRLAEKISVEIRFKADQSVTNYDSAYWIAAAGPVGDPPIYPNLRITNSFITQRSQLYTDPSLLWNLSTPYMKSMIKTEAQSFALPVAFTAASAATYQPIP